MDRFLSYRSGPRYRALSWFLIQNSEERNGCFARWELTAAVSPWIFLDTWSDGSLISFPRSESGTLDLAEREVQKNYWCEHSKELTLEGMMLDSRAEDLDKEDRPEVSSWLCPFPPWISLGVAWTSPLCRQYLIYLLVDETPLFPLCFYQVLSMLPPYNGKNVLELGAGIGRFTGELAKEAGHLLAVDFIDSVLKKVRLSRHIFNLMALSGHSELNFIYLSEFSWLIWFNKDIFSCRTRLKMDIWRMWPSSVLMSRRRTSRLRTDRWTWSSQIGCWCTCLIKRWLVAFTLQCLRQIIILKIYRFDSWFLSGFIGIMFL